jgi:hypothetical protein
MSDGPQQSIKEYWLDPRHNRRKTAGRRECDYAVCPYHDDEIRKNEKSKEHICEKFRNAKLEHDQDMASVFARINQIEDKVVGKWAFGVVITILLAVISISTGASAFMFQSIKADLKAHIEVYNARDPAPK